MSEIRVKGLSDLQRALETLPARIERNVLRGALRAGANVIKPAAKANVHSVSGALAKSIKVRADARGGRVTASVYTRHFTAQWIEYGTKPHLVEPETRRALLIGGLFVRAWAKHPGGSPRAFLRPALDTHAQAAVVAAAEYMKARLATKHGVDTADIHVEPE